MSVIDIFAPRFGSAANISTAFLTEHEMLSVYGQDIGTKLPVTAEPAQLVRDTYRFGAEQTEKFRSLVVGFFKAAAQHDRSILQAPLESKGTPDHPERYLRPLLQTETVTPQKAADMALFYTKISNPLPPEMVIFLPPDDESRDKIADALIPFRKLFTQVMTQADATTVGVYVRLELPKPAQLILGH